MRTLDRNIRLLGYVAIVRATGVSLILPFVALYLRNVVHLGFGEIGLLIAVLGIAPLLLVPFGGLFADRLGRRRLFLLSLFVEALSVAGTGAAMLFRSVPGVIGGALLVSLSGSLGGPALSAYVADLASGSSRTEGFTFLRIGWNVGFTIGVFSGGVLIGALGFSRVGLAAGAVLFVSTAILAALLEVSPYDRARERGSSETASGPVRRPSFGWSLRLLAGDRAFLGLCALVGVAELSVGQWSSTFPLYVNSVLHIPYAILGAGLALNGLLVVIAQSPTTRAAIGRRHTTLVEIGVLLYVVGFLLFGLVAPLPQVVVAGFFVAVFVLTMGENVLSIPTSTLPSNLAPPTEIGAYNGTFFALMGVGQILAPALGGAVLSLGLAPSITWALLMVPAVPAVVASRLWLARKVPERPNTA